jgi:L-alanine-DL-glutamate epimerase-like enolase superfamily enzyme
MYRFADEFNAVWMEQPIDPNDLQGLRFLRNEGPASMDLADGESGWTLHDFRRFADAQAVDVMMVDMTRCGGITGLMRVGGLCLAHELPLSTHCAPSLHLHPCCALPTFRHCEYFHDHARIEEMLLDGFSYPEDGCIQPDLSRPGLGIELKVSDAERFAL